MWETVAQEVENGGGTIEHNWSVSGVIVEEQKVLAVRAQNSSGEEREWPADYFFPRCRCRSWRALQTSQGDSAVPAEVRAISDGLIYRDFITVDLLLEKLDVKENPPHRQ